MATVVEHPTALATSTWQGCQRPWLSLYGLRLRPQGAAGAKQVQLALIQQMLPEEVLIRVLSHLEPYEIGKAACVCRQWSACGKVDSLWKPGCLQAFHAYGLDEVHKLARLQYRHRWRAMFLERPHLRFDGVYVSRNTYIRTGLVEWRVRNPVHLVCYFRYLRFFPDGTLLYRTTPDIVANVASSMLAAGRGTKQGQQVQGGRYRLTGSSLHTALVYPNMAGTEIRARHVLRSTTPGANNRLDVRDIVSFDRGSQTSVPMTLDTDTEDMDGGRAHTRGKATYVFVPWEHVADTPLNLPVDKMDFYVPG